MPKPRTQFGFTRTICACPECALNCRVIPGYLVPEDIMPLFQAYNPDLLPFGSWTMKYLLASPGAIVMSIATGIRRVHTLVPATIADGTCKFLAANGLCLVHAASPYGCAAFDAHQSKEEADRRSREGLIIIMKDESAKGPYSQLWKELCAAGKRSPAPEVLRRQLTQLFKATTTTGNSTNA